MIKIEPTRSADATIIWLHGLGASGHDFEHIVPLLNLPSFLNIRFLLPHAPLRAVTLNRGMRMPAWYDIYSLERFEEEDEKGIKETQSSVNAWIQSEINKGIAPERIFLACFSQGGAVALYTSLSTYLPLAKKLKNEASEVNKKIPIFMAHGYDDSILPLRFGQLSKEVLESEGYAVQWHTYPMDHSVCPEEIQDISRWVQKNIMVMG